MTKLFASSMNSPAPAVLIVMLFGYAFIGIEEIGVEIEDPFGTDPNDLPLDKICQTIQSTLLDTLNKHAG